MDELAKSVLPALPPEAAKALHSTAEFSFGSFRERIGEGLACGSHAGLRQALYYWGHAWRSQIQPDAMALADAWIRAGGAAIEWFGAEPGEWAARLASAEAQELRHASPESSKQASARKL